MILTCPECATRYFLHDVLVGPAGRKVKCTHCGQTWTADPAPTGAEDDGPADAPPPIAAPPDAEPQGAAAQETPLLFSPPKAAPAPKTREGVATAAVWAGIAAAVALLIVGAILFRKTVARLAPQTATAYAAIGLPINTAGLAIEGVHAANAIIDGHRAVTVTGLLLNIDERPVSPPAVKVELLDRAGHAVAAQTTSAPKALIAIGATQGFSVTILDPPPAAQGVQVSFALAGPSPVKPAATAMPARPKPGNAPSLPPPVDAKPLAPDQPDVPPSGGPASGAHG